MTPADARALCGPPLGGIVLASERAHAAKAAEALDRLLARYGLSDVTRCERVDREQARLLVCRLTPEAHAAWTPGFDTLALRQRLDPAADAADHALERETLVAMLASPEAFGLPDVDSLASGLRIRRHIAQAASRTALAFRTEAAERPARYWRYHDEHGFLLRPRCCLVDALVAATQPEATGRVYDFSCYRATEYVILLGIARELREHDPAQFERLARDAERRAIRSGQFHDVFLVEYGEMSRPLPARYYVPGDRLWFRNPDERSSDVKGYEGSWVIYMGGGLFSNFWKRDAPFTLDSKCIEIGHWPDGCLRDARGQLQMDERIVEARCRETEADPAARARLLERMMRMRDPQGVYAEGGCIDSTREYPRVFASGRSELVLPPID